MRGLCKLTMRPNRLLSIIEQISFPACVQGLLATSAFGFFACTLWVWSQDPAPVVAQTPYSKPWAPQAAICKVGPCFELAYQRPQLKVPDLREVLRFWGASERPDVKEANATFFLGLKNGTDVTCAKAGDCIYLAATGDRGYIFSPFNAPTGLWIQARPKAGGVHIDVHMLSERGEELESSQEVMHFTLAKSERPLTAGPRWSVGSDLATPSLLSSQGARWQGKDVFLATYGNEEQKALAAECERIEFTSPEGERYSLFVKEGDQLVFQNKRWQQAVEVGSSQGLPLLVVTAIKERSALDRSPANMEFMLWHPEGLSKMRLTLRCEPEFHASMLEYEKDSLRQQIETDFVYIGQRNLSQYIFDIQDKRSLLEVGDWFLLEEPLRRQPGVNGKWQKLSDVEQLAKLEEGSLRGTVFIIDSISARGSILKGHVVSAGRTERVALELDVRAGKSQSSKPNQAPPDQELIKDQQASYAGMARRELAEPIVVRKLTTNMPLESPHEP